jgi:hypothetical protein
MDFNKTLTTATGVLVALTFTATASSAESRIFNRAGRIRVAPRLIGGPAVLAGRPRAIVAPRFIGAPRIIGAPQILAAPRFVAGPRIFAAPRPILGAPSIAAWPLPIAVPRVGLRIGAPYAFVRRPFVGYPLAPAFPVVFPPAYAAVYPAPAVVPYILAPRVVVPAPVAPRALSIFGRVGRSAVLGRIGTHFAPGILKLALRLLIF